MSDKAFTPNPPQGYASMSRRQQYVDPAQVGIMFAQPPTTQGIFSPSASASAQELKPVRKEQDKPKLDKPPVTANFFVQIGVFSDPDNVKQMQSKLTDKGLKSRADLIDTTKGKKTRLRVGAFSSKNDAEAALEKIKSLGLTGMVVGN